MMGEPVDNTIKDIQRKMEEIATPENSGYLLRR
jgi:hypothetical protein